MTSGALTVFADALSGDGPLDTATSRAILRRVSRGELGEVFEIGVSTRVLAFGKHDTTAPAFNDAVAVANQLGFQPTVRIAGGRAAVFHEATLRFGWTRPVDDPAASMYQGFEAMSAMVTETLGGFGIHAEVGEVPGEYCPGSYSVHIAGRKVMGVGQRLMRNAAHVGGVLVVARSDAINEVLTPVYELLGLTFDPATTGSLADAMPLDPRTVAEAFTAAVAGSRSIVYRSIPESVREEALLFRQDHDPKTP
jgi:lipoate-protein ligase A